VVSGAPQEKTLGGGALVGRARRGDPDGGPTGGLGGKPRHTIAFIKHGPKKAKGVT